MIRSFLPNTQLALAVAFIALLGGAIAAMACAYRQDQYGGDIVMSVGLLAAAMFGWLIGRLYRASHWLLAAFAAVGAVFIYNEAVRAFLEYYRLEVLDWSSSLFRDFSMVMSLMSLVAQALAAAIAGIAALASRSRNSLQPAAPVPPKPMSMRAFLLTGPGLAAGVAAVAILVALAELLAFPISLAAGLAVGGVWLLTAAATAWRVGQFHTRKSAVLAFVSATGLTHWMFGAHDAYLLSVWYEGLNGKYVETLSGAGLLDLRGLWILAGVCGVLASIAAVQRKHER